MDVLRPELIWVDGRCYRKNPSKNNYGLTRTAATEYESADTAGTRSATALRPYEEDDTDNFDIACDPDAPDESDFAYDIEKLESGMFKTRCQNIPNCLYSVIVGAKGTTKKRLESETRTKIIIPFVNEKGDIVIRGQNKKDVSAARRRIDLLISKTRFKRDPTHFLCFPLTMTTFVEKVKEFQELIIAEYSSSALANSLPKMFQDPPKMHLTICVLVLLDQRERQFAAEILNNLKPDILDLCKSGGKNKKFQVKGLEIMNDDPSQADVLYAKCNLPDVTAQKIADLVNDKYLETGLAKPSKGKSVKLHATIINTRLALDVEPEEMSRDNNFRQGSKQRNSFDARPILESKRFREFDFGEVELNEIHLSVRYTTNAKDGFYNCSSKISLD